MFTFVLSVFYRTLTESFCSIKLDICDTMSECSDVISRDSLADQGIIKIEEDGSGSEDKDNPEDLSLKTRSISIQTEDCIQGIISSYFPHLSQDQIQAFLSLLSSILHHNQASREIGEEGHNNIIEVNLYTHHKQIF